MKNRKILSALEGNNQGRPPLWIMRQAGRYLPEYRKIREKHSFIEMCHNPELVVQVTQLPLKRYAFDAAILFSDILVILEGLGKRFHVEEGRGPIIENPLNNAQDIENLVAENVSEKLKYVQESIKALRSTLSVPLLGFSGAPFTVASYLIEGGPSKDLKKTKKWMLKDSQSFHKLLDKIAEQTISYLQMQISAGVQAIQIFDSWANVLGYVQFHEFSLHYLNKIVRALEPTNIPVILYCRGSSVFAEQLASISPRAISVDWQADITQMRKKIPSKIALQGNLDPDILHADHDTIRREVRRLLQGMKGDPGYIFNLGHGIQPDTPLDAVQTLIDCIHE